VVGKACDRLAPQQGAVSHVERDEITVGRPAHERAVLDGGAAIGGRNLLPLGLPNIGPALAASLGIDRDRGAPEREVHHPLIDERARLHRSRLIRAVQADRSDIPGVCRGDLLEIDETRAGIVVRGVEPAIGRRRGGIELGLGRTHDFRKRRPGRLRRCGRVFERRQVGEESSAAGRFGHCDRHRRSRYELARVGQELSETVGSPDQAGALQRRREVEACKRAGFTPGNAGERRSDAVRARLIGMAG
jgi:hypothetical protein